MASSSIPGNENSRPINPMIRTSHSEISVPSKQPISLPSPSSSAASSSTQKLEPGNVVEITKKIREVAKAVGKKAQVLTKKSLPTHLSQAIQTLKKIDHYYQNKFAAFDQNFLKVRVGDFGTTSSTAGDNPTFLYVSYDKNTQKVQVVFDKNVIPNFKAGAFKKVRTSYRFSPEGKIKPVMVTKQNIESEEGIIGTRREEATYRICKDAGITEGIPKAHSIGIYTSQKGIEKQIITQNFITGGTLEDALDEPENLTSEERLNIAVKLAETLSKFHAAGLSHNDLKPGNVMLDAKKNPILIDFGTTTNPDDNQLIGGSLGYFPPELGGNQALLDKFNETREEINTLSYEMYNLQEIIDDKESKPEHVKNASLDLNKYKQTITKLQEEETEIQNEMVKQIEKKDISTDWIPQKNDDYALGVILKELFANDPNFEEGPVREVINGLLFENPMERLSSAAAFALLKSLNS